MKKTLLGLVALLTLFSCKKEENTPSNVPSTKQTKTEMLSAHGWKLDGFVSIFEVPGGQPFEFDVFDSLEPCEKDNLFFFNAGNVFVQDEGNSKCISTDPQKITGEWSFNENDETLFWTYDSESFECDVISISTNKLVLEAVVEDESGIFGDTLVKITFIKA